MLLFETICEAFIREKDSLDAQQMFYFLRGALVGYCLDHEMDIAGSEAMFMEDIKGMANQLATKQDKIVAMKKAVDIVPHIPSAQLLRRRLQAIAETHGIWADIPDDNEMDRDRGKS